MASLKDVAVAAQVSIRTVGRVLSEQGYVQEQTRQQVLSAARELGYRPNRMARSLRTGQSYQVSVVLGSTDELHIEKLAAFQQCLEQRGYAVNVCFASTGQVFLENLWRDAPAAVALFPMPDVEVQLAYNRLEQAGIPVVAIDPRRELAAAVYIDRRQGVRESVQFLIERGYARIAYLGPGDSTRWDGYAATLASCGRSVLWVETGGSALGQYEEGYQGLERLLKMQPRPDAVQVFSDVMAMGVLAAAHANGIAIPQDLAVIGFDDRRMARYAHPRLTTVAQPNAAVGVAAGEMLLGALQGQLLLQSRTIAAKLVQRAST